MLEIKYIADLVIAADNAGKKISEIVWQWECEQSGVLAESIWEKMQARLETIKISAYTGKQQQGKTFNGLVGGDAYRMAQTDQLLGGTVTRAVTYALSVSEVNADMGKIVACPTAGSCGIVPGALLATAELLKSDNDVIIKGLFTAAGIGTVIAKNASVAGAIGGCQAECGSAAAMAAGAVVEMMGGTPRQVSQAVALTLKNLLGLVCDPVAGLVEVPCVKRNGFAAAHALVGAQMALAEIESVIPADEVIEAMNQIGLALPSSLKETSEAGLAKTSTALSITARILK
ncbi:MAG: L-serine dehydratase, iron-sulfur-dependent subunit alpha [Firmicutes bacterium]|nr:L-serine dehydratase, iron-sulfur-dependent subunit alpha [Bacillota bacterium]